ncbi:ABC transporter permease [soil metagenome]
MELSLSIVANGVASGFALFLAAAGLTVLFGILRILNFAHGSLVMLGAYAGSIVLARIGHYNIAEFLLVAVLSGVIIGLLGLLLDQFVFRRLQGRDESITLIATFAIMLAINGAAELAWGAKYVSVNPPAGLDGALTLGQVTLPTFSVMVAALGLIVFVVLEVFFHRSWTGKTLRAVAEDRWIVSLLGHSPRRLELQTVFLAFFLAGFAGSMLAPNQILAPGLGNQLIIQAFAVVIVGGLGSVRGSFLAAMLLGLAEAIGSLVMPSLSLYVCMILILIVRPQGLIASTQTVPGSWSFAWLRQGLSSVRETGASSRSPATPRAFSGSQDTGPARFGKGQIASLGLVLLVLLALPLAGGGVVFVASLALITILFSMSWNLMFGYTGLAVFGHAAFFAMGGYLSAYMIKSGSAVPFLMILVLAALAGGVLAALVGVIAIRRANGIQLAILTLSLAEVLRVLISSTEVLGRDEGIPGVARPALAFWTPTPGPMSDVGYYFFLCAACALGVAALWVASHSALGRALRCIRQDAERARFLGINVDFFKLLSFVIAAAVAAYAGALAAPLTQIATPQWASVAKSTQPMLNTLVGGAGTFWGPAVGTLVFGVIDYATRTLAGLSILIMGITLIVIVLVEPNGVAAAFETLMKRRSRVGASARNTPSLMAVKEHQ